MGAWGTGILQNDTTADVWAEFKQLYHLENSVKEIIEKLEKEYSPEDDLDEYADFWTGIAHGQWMCGELEPQTIAKLNECIKTGKGLEIWKENEKDYNKRVKVISEFIDKIKVPKEKPLKRKKIIPCLSYFNKGDIISIQIKPSRFIYALVFEKEDHGVDGSNRLVFSSLITDYEISAQEFLDSDVMYLDKGGSNNYHQGYYWGDFQARNMKRKIKKTNLIENVSFENYLGLSNSIPYGDWNTIEKLYNEQTEIQSQNNTTRPFNISMRQFIKGEDEDFELKLAKHANELWKEKLKEMNAT